MSNTILDMKKHGELIRFMEHGQVTGYGLYLKTVLGSAVPVRAIGPARAAMEELIAEVRCVDGIAMRGKGRSYISPRDEGVLEICEGTNPAVEEGDVLDLDAVARVVRAAGYDLSVRDVVHE